MGPEIDADTRYLGSRLWSPSTIRSAHGQRDLQIHTHTTALHNSTTSTAWISTNLRLNPRLKDGLLRHQWRRRSAQRAAQKRKLFVEIKEVEHHYPEHSDHYTVPTPSSPIPLSLSSWRLPNKLKALSHPRQRNRRSRPSKLAQQRHQPREHQSALPSPLFPSENIHLTTTPQSSAPVCSPCPSPSRTWASCSACSSSPGPV